MHPSLMVSPKCSNKTATNITNVFAAVTALSIKNQAVSLEAIGSFPQKVGSISSTGLSIDGACSTQLTIYAVGNHPFLGLPWRVLLLGP